MATGDGGSAPGMAVPAPLLGGGPRCSWPPLHGAEFLGVVELETGADVGTLTGLVGVGGGGGATGTAGLIKGWLKKVSKSLWYKENFDHGKKKNLSYTIYCSRSKTF